MYRKTLKNSVSIHEFLEEVQNCKEREDSFYRGETEAEKGASYAAEPGLEFKRTELPSTKPRRLPFFNWQRTEILFAPDARGALRRGCATEEEKQDWMASVYLLLGEHSLKPTG